MFENAKSFVVENAVAIGCAAAASVVSGVAGYWFGKRKGAAAAVAAVTVAPASNEKSKEEKKDNDQGSDEAAK